MKEFQAQTYSPTHGQLNIHMRIIGRKIYLKTSTSEPARQMIDKLREGGAQIFEGTKGWIEIDMFVLSSCVRLGGKEFDIEEISVEELENILFNFYTSKYREAHYEIKVIK
jgi:hypothetical protein